MDGVDQDNQPARNQSQGLLGRFERRYEIEKKQHLSQGAQLDQDNGSIIRTSSRKNKIEASSREGNIALEVDRPQLPEICFSEFKSDLLSPKTENLTLTNQKFLNQDAPEAIDQDTVIMVSFPRSGNTLLRAYLEKIMGLTSGSDCDITKKLNKDLMMMGLAGEGLVDKRVLVVKTHYPERYGKTKFYAERAILLVRNPLDSIVSLFNMVCTGSHNKSIHDEDFIKFASAWDDFIDQDLSVWVDFHEFWMNAKIPVHVIRYEDIVQKPEPTLRSLLEFIMNVESIEGTKLDHYLSIAVKEQSPEIYKPRVGKAHANLDKFTLEQYSYVFDGAYKFMRMYDYEDFFTSNGAVHSLSAEEKELQFGQINPKNFIEQFNQKALKESIRLQNESDEVTSIYINYPALLLRKKSEMYPEGRTSHRFKNFLRRRVTIVDRNNQVISESVKDVTEVDEAEQELNN